MKLGWLFKKILPPLFVDLARSLTRRRTVKSPKRLANLSILEAKELQDRVPAFIDFSITPENAPALVDFYNSLLPLYLKESHGSYLRSRLFELKQRVPFLAEQIAVEIARSNLTDGMPDRAQILKNDPRSVDELKQQTIDLETSYGADLINGNWINASRGATLLLYFSNHRELIAKKRVLHIAPEPELRDWLAGQCDYTALDAVPSQDGDVCADITSLPLKSQSFDIIICHRVLEHVLNDLGAMKQFFRVLIPGGALNISVPQAVHREKTAEWIYPDASHHGHVRHYGKDFSDRLAEAGFKVTVIDWLLKQRHIELDRASAYPMRIYEATVPSSL